VTDRVSDLFDKSRNSLFKAQPTDIVEPLYGPGMFGAF
jgi:hypothetical protein